MRIRLAELVALLSLGTDLGLGQPMEHMIRASLLALRLADRLKLADTDRKVIYFSGLLAWVGCHTDAYEQAKWLGEDIASKRDAHYAYDFGRARDVMRFMMQHLGGAGRPLMERVKTGVLFLGDGKRALGSLAENHYRATDDLAASLGLGDDVRVSLRESFERWDGKGAFRMKGDTTRITSRLVCLADVVEAFRRTAGAKAALTVVRDRRGTQFDPALVDLLCAHASELFEDFDQASSWEAILAHEPALSPVLSEDKIDDALLAVGDFAELKSPWSLGHASAVASLAERAAVEMSLDDEQRITLRRAALVHDLGHLGVSNTIWDSRNALSAAERERVRLHPYWSDRMLSFLPALRPLAAIVAQHHERLDGSGYPNGVLGNAISPSARILAAADVYQALVSERSHRAALSREDAAAELRREVRSKRLDGDAVSAVLRSAGHRVGKRRALQCDLTPREVDVLVLVARGLSNKEIGARLFIAPKTVGNHVEHIYAKVGVQNRAMASLFAMKHGLVHDEE
jgi:HD-GYP domain-containing protein (c-di-GMP phosphodiesterase class II)